MSVESSRKAFLDALGTLLEREAGKAPGVNAVAKQAGLNKVLIYRYFGSWEGLLEEFARRVNPWRDIRLEAETGFAEHRWTALAPFVKWLFQSYLARLDSDALLISLLARASVDRDPLQTALESDREREGMALAQLAVARFPDAPADALSVVALLTGGLTWVTLLGRKTGMFSGMRFDAGGDGMTRLGAAADRWVDALLKSKD